MVEDEMKKNILSYLHVPRCSDGRLYCPHTQLDVFMAETECSVKPMFFAPAGLFSSYGRYHTERPSLRSPCSRECRAANLLEGSYFTQQVLITSVSTWDHDWSLDDMGMRADLAAVSDFSYIS